MQADLPGVEVSKDMAVFRADKNETAEQALDRGGRRNVQE
jgi:hypothetical protein